MLAGFSRKAILARSFVNQTDQLKVRFFHHAGIRTSSHHLKYRFLPPRNRRLSQCSCIRTGEEQADGDASYVDGMPNSICSPTAQRRYSFRYERDAAGDDDKDQNNLRSQDWLKLGIAAIDLAVSAKYRSHPPANSIFKASKASSNCKSLSVSAEGVKQL
eukprot:405907-Hanusia_phi.AAC.3